VCPSFLAKKKKKKKNQFETGGVGNFTSSASGEL
jgi:hypothetical protein